MAHSPHSAANSAGATRETRGTIGSVAVITGIVFFALNLWESSSGIPGMPNAWYLNRPLWWIGSLVVFSWGFFLVGQGSASTRQPDYLAWSPQRSGRRFERLVLYTRDECPLCDEAVALLLRYQRYLPEIQEVDVDLDPMWLDLYGSTVPVVEFDGKVRFRGRINEVLLRRLIDGTPPYTQWVG